MIRPSTSRLRSWLPSPPQELSLGTLLGVVVMAALMPLILVGGFGIYRFAVTERASEMSRVASTAASLSRALDRELHGFLDSAEILAGQPPLQEGDLAEFERLAKEAAEKSNGDFVLVDRSFQQLVNTRLESGATLPKTGNPDGVRQVFETKRATIGDLGYGAVAHQLLFGVRVPVTVRGEVRYVLAYAPRSDAIVDILKQTYLPDGWFAAVLGRDGLILARSSRHEEFFGRSASDAFVSKIHGASGLVESTDLEGRSSVTAHHQSELSQWRAVVWAPEAVLSAPLNRALSLTLVMSGLALAMSLAAALLAGRMIAQPSRRVVKAARALGEGRPVQVAPTLMHEANIVFGALADASKTIAAREAALRNSEQKTRFVMRELSHRSKNLLAIVQAMARQTARATSDYKEFQERFADRISSLARSHDLLVHHDWNGIAISELIKTQLAPFIDADGNRLSVEGPSLVLKPEAAQTIGMALHELATNASKYGALSAPAGRVEVKWRRETDAEGAPRLEVHWREIGGPPVEKPARAGFGHNVVEGMVAASLNGKAQLSWNREGVVWSLDVPADCLAADVGT